MSDAAAGDGELPMNTGGRQLGGGRLHGFGLAYEAVVQLRGAGGARQGAGDSRIAVVTNGGGPQATALLLARESEAQAGSRPQKPGEDIGQSGAAFANAAHAGTCALTAIQGICIENPYRSATSLVDSEDSNDRN